MTKASKTASKTVMTAAAVALLWGLARPARAQAPVSAADFARLQAEVQRLQQEVREQRQEITTLMQDINQRYDMILRLLQATPGAPPVGSIPAPPALRPPEGREPPSAAQSAGGVGSISGRVRSSEGDLGEAYVYVDGLHAPTRNHVVEIRQKSKRFVPSVAVVPLGSKLLFPNEDTVEHNVFSPTPGNVFDLKKVKAGDKPPPVVALKPGPLEVFCNIHSDMRADVLVVPNPHWARVAADGSFQIFGVPVGARTVVVWGPRLERTSQRVEVTSRGATANLVCKPSPPKPHLNKLGEPYGSYE